MTAYFIRRLLLVPITFVGITLMVYLVLRATPGNPVETELMSMQAVGGEGGGGRSTRTRSSQVPPLTLLELVERYRMDKGVWEGYFGWLGVVPQEDRRTSATFGQGSAETRVTVAGLGREVTVVRDGDRLAGRPRFDDGTELGPEWSVRLESPEQIAAVWKRVLDARDDPPPQPWRVVVFQPRFSGILQGDLGRSTLYNLDVWEMMRSRFPISLLFGVTSLLLVYLICIPLGVSKALRHGGWYDSITSVAVFAGFAVPGYALAAILMVYLGARLHWFPISGLTSPGFEQMGFFRQVLDVAHHSVLPLLCYVIGSFAKMTMMVKNNLMDQLGSDYIRTAVAKGVSYRRAVVGHALRNSLIPIATTFGAVLSVFVGGSFLIEMIFDINGFGLMNYRAVLDRDYFVIMGGLAVSSLLLMLGNILSDFAVAVVDPRVSYQ